MLGDGARHLDPARERLQTYEACALQDCGGHNDGQGNRHPAQRKPEDAPLADAETD
jgi:hypothetical protein